MADVAASVELCPSQSRPDVQLHGSAEVCNLKPAVSRRFHSEHLRLSNHVDVNVSVRTEGTKTDTQVCWFIKDSLVSNHNVKVSAYTLYENHKSDRFTVSDGTAFLSS